MGRIMVLGGILLVGWAPPGEAADRSEECLSCHGNREALGWSRDDRSAMTAPQNRPIQGPRGKRKVGEVSLFVDASRFKASIHGALSCTDCHGGIREVPHPPRLESVRCARCHEGEDKAYGQSIHGQASRSGVNDAPLCQDCHGGHDIVPVAGAGSPVAPTQVAETCATCHADDAVAARERLPIAHPYKAYRESIHARAVGEGLDAATCTSCHGGHGILPATAPASTVFKANIPSTCGRCHGDVYETYRQSVHGNAFFSRGNPRAPVCTDCHGEHDILPPGDPASAVYAATISKTTCPQCHASATLVKRYGLPADRLASYQDSYHGLADKFGDTTVANCASCHGVHDIFRSNDPRSKVNPANLRTTCGKCHPGATKNFAAGLVHGPLDGERALGEWVKRIVRSFYVLLIAGVIGGMLLHNGLDWFARVREHYRRHLEEARVERLTRGERLQHLVMLVSFLVLAGSGFALRFRWEVPFLSGGGNTSLRQLVHRSAAVVFVLVGIWHVVYLLLTRRGRDTFRAMLPERRDLEDLWGMLRFNLGLLPERPRFGRFSYVEKAEYLALLWGSVVMIATGLTLWFEGLAMWFLPKWGVDVAGIVHLYEAVLATLAVAVWHFYHVHWRADVAPMNFAWWTGDVTERQMEEEHPLEIEARTRGKAEDPEGDDRS